MQAARLCEMHYRLDFRLLMLRRQLLRATGFLPEDNMAALHSNVAELSLKKRDIAQDNLQLVKNIEQGMLQLGEGHLTSRDIHEVFYPTERK